MEEKLLHYHLVMMNKISVILIYKRVIEIRKLYAWNEDGEKVMKNKLCKCIIPKNKSIIKV